MNAPAAKQNGLVVADLQAGYGHIKVLHGVSCEAPTGRVLALLGRNGAGKSTMLNALAGLLPAVGSIRLNDVELIGRSTEIRLAHGLSLVPEGRRIFRRRTVEENLLIGAVTLPRAQRKVAIEEVYVRFPLLAERRRQLGTSLSGGQQQILAIAQAVVARPAVLLLDEPSAGLAPAVFDQVLDTIQAFKELGIAIVLVEQKIAEAMSIADDVVVLDQGRIALSGRTENISFDHIRDVYMRGKASAGDLI